MSNGQKAIRSQGDDDQDIWNDHSALSFDGTIDLARQEFAEESDVNFILSRYGVDELRQRNAVFGTRDYTIDLQQALAAVEAAERAYAGAPERIKELYANWREMLAAAEDGTLKVNLEKEPEPAPLKTPTTTGEPQTQDTTDILNRVKT